MRWYEWTALILIAALTLGAFVFGTEWAANRFFAARTDAAFHDTYYVEAHMYYMRTITLILAGGAAVYALILLWGRIGIRRIASATIALWGLCVALAVLPQHFVSLRGPPRRYMEGSELSAVFALSNAANFIAMIAALAMIALLIAALTQRLRRPQRDGAAP